jgi:hypothetical protein
VPGQDPLTYRAGPPLHDIVLGLVHAERNRGGARP